ncbi:MAG TPA: methyltransferase domain-containing protein [Candidatus Binatia bacterium]|nr:methyltransferase domain-containing protein [Candidatus Binatia bacterium]
MSETSSNKLKAQVKEFWNKQSCDTWHTQSDKFSREYFDQIEQWRYNDQPFIHSFAQFSRYHGKRVLEVGFGAGTDFIQWLRAGAIVSGVDLTEEALANLTRRIQVYGLPQPESLHVADAEHLPFPDNTFDLGYSWGVLHHTPDTGKAVAELVRVVRPGGEVKIMLYNRRALITFKHWVKYALLKGKPWKSFRWTLWHHMESIGTKGYTSAEILKMLAPLGLTDIRMDNYVTSWDRTLLENKKVPVADALLGFAANITGTRLGFFKGITAIKT